ncbi:MAG TPA: T9SS type A sorting domain-containing protein [Bacteroides sp.]|nr:T9SS type A sorting domain-containing protein [Bacteroides sp.]
MMRKIYLNLSFVLAVAAFMAAGLQAQIRYVDVAPGIGTLNEAIAGDTTATGERNDPLNTVYRLQRGPEAYYGLTGSISNDGFPLTIMAAEGDGARPFLQPRVVVDESSRAFRPKGDIRLVGLHVTNLDDLGGLNDRILRCSEDNIKIYAEDCWFDKASQSFIRTDNPGQSYFLTDCVISNIGEPGDPNNGRGIDDRGNDIDTVYMKNCTWYNVTSRVIRDDGGTIKYAHMENNTLVNVGQMGITFGPIEELNIFNNIGVNLGFMPKDDDDGWIVFSADSVGGMAPRVNMYLNSIYLDSTKLVPWLNDTTTVTPLFNPTLLQALLDSGTLMYNFNMSVEFTDGPPFPDSMLIYHYDPAFDVANAPFWEEPAIPGVGEGGNGVYHLDVPYDFGYVNNKAFVAALDGKALGDRNWETDRGDFVPVDFEDPQDRLFWWQFANAGDAPENMAIIPNPDKSGINTSDHVMMYNVLPGADPWAGAFSDAVGYMNFTQEKHHMEMMVWKSKVSNCGLKVEQGGTVTEVKVPNTLTGEWELVKFDFSNNIGETLTRLVFFPDFPDARTEGTTVYLDNINIITSPAGGVETAEGKLLKVYPNPVRDQLVVDYPGMTYLVVRDVLGKVVRSANLGALDHATLAVEDLSEGLYFVTVGTQSGSVTAKFLKR